VSKLSFDPRSEFLACAGKSDVVVWSAEDRTKHSTIKLPPDYTIREVAVSPEGRYIATTSTNGEARLRDTRDNTDATLPFGDAQSVSFSPDGRWLSIGSQSEIKLWNPSAKKFDPRRIPAGGFAMKFSPDGSLLATKEDENGKISLWKWNVREPLLEGTVREL
jgi:WD40 repeat protein